MKEKENQSVIEKISTQIVDKRNGFILIYFLMVIFCLFSRNWVAVNNDIKAYLPDTTETRQGLTLMEDEFTTFGTAQVMVSNITYSKAEELKELIESVDGVKSVTFDDSKDHFTRASALFLITTEGEESEEISKQALSDVLLLLEPFDVSLNSTILEDSAASLEKEIQSVMVVAVFIILGVLLFTSKTYMEIPVLLITFGVAAILNMGTHFLYGEISFVSNSIAVILQLALAIDYAIILCHRFTEEREYLPAREAAIKALSKAIPEISSSSLTTISGLMALMFMEYGLGFDMGLVLIKALLFSLLIVFTLMPGLLMIFSDWMDKTVHKNFVPKITPWGKMVVKTRYIVPILFMCVLVGAFYFSNQTNYVYGFTKLETIKQNDSQLQKEKIEDYYGSRNIMAVLVPAGDYEKEGDFIRRMETLDVVDQAVGLANTEAIDGYMVTDGLNPRQFAELTDVDIEVANMLYSGYAVDQETYGKLINGLDEYSVPLLDIFMFLYDQKEAGYFTLDEELEDELNDMHDQLSDGMAQLKGKNYSRILMILDMPEEGDKAFEQLDEFHDIAYEYYDDVYFVGNITSNNDLGTSFAKDNLIITILSALFVMIILLFTFKSAGLPVLLVLTIQGSIWMNFSFPALQGTNIFFMSYLVVTAIQMGATIDYAIVITSRYMELKRDMPIHEAMIESLNQAFPTIITSGTILASSGILIGFLSSDYAVSSIGICLGRGTIISLILVMGVLPQTLLLGDYMIEKSAFTLKRRGIIQSHTGSMKMNGKMQGYISGYVDAEIKGTIRGDVKGMIEMGSVEKEVKNHEKIQ
ncbi:RND transporter [Acidaminobacter sp. JC074]|uniref:efflux RND transporter permease subunit n=1 Tax=Acidaminobacter sp. JC074 TaxID=2530199 RepID=UPI001F0FB6CE|nr:MMPL family transporter [Acidaminobacter sp. JC074]MCH4885969.1 RND transporter [Acidaminobacter sp. JC074]